MATNYTNPSGFPEHIPSVLQEELRIRDIMRSVYESYGYVPIETPSVEYKETLASKGDISKEVYTIARALAEGDSKEDDRALRFDLTIPFARYVAQHFNDLTFPFKRWQIQRVWRGERPQAGRFREFYQSDIDVIGNGSLPIHFDAEVVAMVHEVLNEIDFGGFTIGINHRKLLQGILKQFGITDLENTLRIIDKCDKIGLEKTINALEESGLKKDEAEKLMNLLEVKTPIDEIDTFISQIEANNDLIKDGVSELKAIASLLKGKSNKNGKIVFNPKIARGLDYYTGSVYETTIDGYEKYGSICSGGRYENLAGKFSNKELPGVGISIGLSRLMYILEKESLLPFDKAGVTDIYILLLNESQRFEANKVADQLRSAGIRTQVSHDGEQKLGKQFNHAEKSGAQYGLIINEGEDSAGTMTLKNLNERSESIVKSVEEVIKIL
ncbi:histidine--tRNA ligase [Candidatus Peregrinibacteria bacterium CG10_big_fil_rev_8_21_14_0_10_36_19]|nr:MAG: histidine--tRNA ligase [Candidatus Peregrinibacteria bacterium CG10_big_fil_rev_8_21_14_0_10_36_19]